MTDLASPARQRGPAGTLPQPTAQRRVAVKSSPTGPRAARREAVPLDSHAKRSYPPPSSPERAVEKRDRSVGNSETPHAHPPNQRLLAHLRAEREHLTTFLRVRGVQATNWRSEQALRPAIVNRKSWGGNRTWGGAHTQEVTISVIRTARQQAQDPIEVMAAAQLHRTPAITDRLAIPTARSDPALAA